MTELLIDKELGLSIWFGKTQALYNFWLHLALLSPLVEPQRSKSFRTINTLWLLEFYMLWYPYYKEEKLYNLPILLCEGSMNSVDSQSAVLVLGTSEVGGWVLGKMGSRVDALFVVSYPVGVNPVPD